MKLTRVVHMGGVQVVPILAPSVEVVRTFPGGMLGGNGDGPV